MAFSIEAKQVSEEFWLVTATLTEPVPDVHDYQKMSNVREFIVNDQQLAFLNALAKNNLDALHCVQVAKQTVDGWTVDAGGRVNVHTDVISKAVNAAVFTLE